MPRGDRYIAPPIERFMAKIHVADNGCWLWTADMQRKNGGATGYGYFHSGKKRYLAHRWSYMHFTGPIPDGMTIDHTCHNTDPECAGGTTCSHRRCVNPEHLEAVTNAVNLRRGKGFAGRYSRQTFCKHGHSLTLDNVAINSRGHRLCLACQRERQKTEAHRAYMRQYQREYRKGLRRRQPSD